MFKKQCLDVDLMITILADRLCLPIDIVQKVIDAETEYMVEIGLAKK